MKNKVVGWYIGKYKDRTYGWGLYTVEYKKSEIDWSESGEHISISEHVGILSSINLSLIFK